MSTAGARHLPTLQQKRRSRRSKRFDHGQPISRMSMAPIAIALSVVAMMIYITTPVQTHALILHLPNENTGDGPATYRDESGPTHRIAVTSNDVLLYDGVPMNAKQLAAEINALKLSEVTPSIIYEPDPDASYDMVVRALAVIQLSGGFILPLCIGGMEKHRVFDYGETQRWGSSESNLNIALTLSYLPGDRLEPVEYAQDSCQPMALVSPAI